MATDFLSPYINFSIRPLINGDSWGLDFEIWSNQIDLAKLPGTKHIDVTLTVGGFADGTSDGPTHHEEGYAPFKPTPDGSRLKLKIERLRCVEEWVEGTKEERGRESEEWREVELGGVTRYFRVLNGGSRIVKGVAALVLKNQMVALYGNSDHPAASLQGCEVVLARVHFALIPAVQGRAFVLEQRSILPKRRALLTLTPQDVDGPKALCIVHRTDLESAPPDDWRALPGAPNYTIHAPKGHNTPEMRLEFRLLDNWLSFKENGKSVRINPRQVSIYELSGAAWEPAPLCPTPADDGRIAVCTSRSVPLALMWKKAAP